MEVGGYLAILRRWWLTIIVATLAASVAGYGVARGTDPIYESSTRLLVGPVTANSLSEIQAAERLTQTYAELVTGADVLQAAIDSTPLATSVSELRQAVSARGTTATRLLRITVEMSDPRMAAATADGLADALIRLTAAPPGTSGALTVLDPARVPVRPTAPQLALIAALAGLSGFAGAMVLVLFAEYFRDRVGGRSDIEELLGAPVLATVPANAEPGPERNQMPATLPLFPVASSYRALTASLVETPSGTIKSLLVAGTDMQRSHTEVALNIACAAAHDGHQAVLIDADAGGLKTWIEAEGRGMGSSRSRPIEVISGRAVGDSPAAIWAARCDAVVFVAIRDRSRRAALTDAVTRLGPLAAKMNGVILVEHGGHGRRLPTWRRGRKQSGKASPEFASDARLSDDRAADSSSHT